MATAREENGTIITKDEAMRGYCNLVTRWTPEQIERFFGEIAAGRLHPRDAKMRLAREIVEIFHGKEGAGRAEEHFRTVFQEHELPPEIPQYAMGQPTSILELLVATGLARSRSEARRLVQQDGVRLDDRVVSEIDALVEPQSQVLQVGRRHYLRLIRA